MDDPLFSHLSAIFVENAGRGPGLGAHVTSSMRARGAKIWRENRPFRGRFFLKQVAGKMMVGGEPTETKQIQRKSLLTLDQQNSCSDIFVSISGLIGAPSPPLLHSLAVYSSLCIPYFSSRSWEDDAGH